MLSALKLIELISFCGVEDFYMHQWMFMFDYPGLEIKSIKHEDYENIQCVSPFEFSPYAAICLPNSNYIDYRIKDNLDEEMKDNKVKDILGTPSISGTNLGDNIVIKEKELKRRIIITENKIENDFQLTAKTKE